MASLYDQLTFKTLRNNQNLGENQNLGNNQNNSGQPWYNAQSVLPIDFGVQKFANYASNALPNNQNNSGQPWWMNADRSRYSSPMMPPMLDQTGQMGASNYQAPNTLDPNWQHQLRLQEMQANAPDTPKTGIWQSLKSKLGNIPFPSVANVINKITRPGADQSFAGYPSGAASRGGLYATEVANMQKLADMGRLTSGGKDWVSGLNVVSGFGDYNKGMQKSLDRFTQTAKDLEKAGKFKGYSEDEDSLDKLAAYYKAQYGPVKGNAVLQRLLHTRQMTGPDSTGDVSTTKITAPARDQIDQGGVGDSGFNPTFDQPSSPQSEPTWHEATAARDTVAGPGFGSGAYWAQGGRVDYNRGRVVNPGGYQGKDDEYDTSWRAFTQNPTPDLTDLDIDDALRLGLSTKQVYQRWMDRRNWRKNKAQGGRVGYFDGGLAGLL